MKPILRTVLTTLAAALLVAAGILIAAPPRGHSVTLLPAPTPPAMQVHIVGAVRSPGLFSLPNGSRLIDALEAAGGLTETADTDRVNLAAILNDGEKWSIPERGSPSGADLPVGPETAQSEPEASAGTPPEIVHLNTATAAELETLPGIGPSLANDILAYREANGPFATVEGIMDVPGIGPAKFENLRPFAVVD